MPGTVIMYSFSIISSFSSFITQYSFVTAFSGQDFFFFNLSWSFVKLDTFSLRFFLIKIKVGSRYRYTYLPINEKKNPSIFCVSTYFQNDCIGYISLFFFFFFNLSFSFTLNNFNLNIKMNDIQEHDYIHIKDVCILWRF